MADDDAFKAGDVCFDCQQLGIVKYLRYFKINLNGDTLLKCESNECMYPYNDEFSSTDKEEADEETNSIKFIDDLLQQIKNETAEQNSINSGNENVNKNTEDDDKYKSTEVDTHFEISFFDTFEEIVNENLSQATNLETETKEYAKDSKTNIPSLLSLPLIDTDVMEQAASQLIDKFDMNKDELSSSMPSLFDCDVNKEKQSFSLPSLHDTRSQSQPKINIQSIETIKTTSQLNENNVFISTKMQPNVSTHNTFKAAPTASSESSVKPLVKTKARRKPNVSANRTLKDAHESSVNLPVDSAPPIETKTFAIPKANIMKGSDFLKKLAVIDEKTPKYNIKCKEARKRATNKQQKTDNNLSRKEETKDTEFKRDKQEMNFSLEAIAQLLNANKKKNAN